MDRRETIGPDANRCPECGSKGWLQTGVDADDDWRGVVYVHCYCPDCGTRYTNVYRLAEQDVD